MSTSSRTSGPSGLRRAWLRELGIDHVWTLPAPPTVTSAAGAPAAAEPADPIARPAEAVVQSSALPESSPLPITTPAAEPMTAEDTALESPSTPAADVYRREPYPDPYRTPPRDPQAPSSSSSGAPVYSREPVADIYSREPYVDPAEQAQAGQGLTPTGGDSEAAPVAGPAFAAVTSPATTPAQEDWLLVGEGLDKDVAAPARQRFLAALLAAQGHGLGEVRAWPQAAEEGAAALIVMGTSACAALAPDGRPYTVGEVVVDGVPLPALLLPDLAQVSLNAEGKAATWRGLLRLSAQVNGVPD